MSVLPHHRRVVYGKTWPILAGLWKRCKWCCSVSRCHNGFLQQQISEALQLWAHSAEGTSVLFLWVHLCRSPYSPLGDWVSSFTLDVWPMSSEAPVSEQRALSVVVAGSYLTGFLLLLLLFCLFFVCFFLTIFSNSSDCEQWILI